MAALSSNEVVLDELRHGLAQFEVSTSPVASVSASSNRPHQRGNPFAVLSGATGHHTFARIGPSLGGGSPASKKVERYSVQKITGDGRCMFRALVKGMALNKGVKLHPRDERDDADELRMAVKEAICDDEKERIKYEEALIAITVEESLRRYYQSCVASQLWYTYQNRRYFSLLQQIYFRSSHNKDSSRKPILSILSTLHQQYRHSLQHTEIFVH